MAIKMEIRKPCGMPLCVKKAYTFHLCDKFSELNNIPEYIGTQNFQKFTEHYGIKKVLVDAAAKPHLDNREIVKGLLSNLSMSLKENLARTLGGTGVKMLHDDDLNKLYFLRSKENICIFSLIGFSTSELRFGPKDEDCPNIHWLKRYVRDVIDPVTKAQIKKHLKTCLSCADIVSTLKIRNQFK